MPRILVADDNSNIQKMVVLVFQERGIEVTSVGNGEAAVRRLPDLNPDLVLADVFMPVRNGYEVCEFVKKDQRFAHIPVILLVGAFDPLDEKEARRVGADGVLKKPFVPPDPLIAMVMSALEKNPKLAAEVAKAKKAESEPVAAVPFEPQSVPEPRPLPKYPDPSPEEDAAIYGFGNGARALHDAGLPEESKPPKALDAETDEDEVASETAHNIWRRTAMEFEVPAVDASRPALSADEHLDSAMFPSERDVPPRHVRMRDVAFDDEVMGKNSVSASIEEPSTAVPVPVVEAPQSVHAAGDVAKLPVMAAVSEESTPSEAAKQTRAPEAHVEAAHEAPKPAVHWMDMMAPLPTVPPSGDWMSALRASAVSESRLASGVIATTVQDAVQPATDLANVATPEKQDLPSESVAEASAAPLETKLESASEAVALPPVPPDQLAALPEAQSQPEQPFFAGDLVVAEAPGFDHNLLVTAPDLPVSANLRDPDLDGPVAVRVTPEPLLVKDEAVDSSGYNSQPEATAPMHSLDYPVAPSSEQGASEAETNIEDKPATSESVLEEASARGESTAPSPAVEPEQISASQALTELNPVDWTERIPTVPPPNREALAEIPFLTPPAEFKPQATEGGVDSATVDAVVRKVLERLESQIHGMLSQGALKPLVENLLEGELSKKEK